MHCTLNMCITW